MSQDHTKPTEVRRDSSSSSYLVRVWQESGEGADLRFYLRDLKTGEERYVGDSTQIGELLARGLAAKHASPSRKERLA